MRANILSNMQTMEEARIAQDSSQAPTETAKTTSAVIKQERIKMADGVMSLMEFSSDLSEAEAPPPLPAGEYPAQIVKAEFKVGTTSGNPYLAVMFRVEPETYPADFEGNPEGETFSYNRLSVKDDAQGRYRVRKFLEAVGGKLGTTLDPNELIGLTATIGIVHGKWEGETRAECAKVIAS